jgi:hypothetical protein
LAGVTSSLLILIAASGHKAPPGAHLVIVGVLIVGVVVALAVGARRRRNAADQVRDAVPTERERREP